MPTVVCPSGTWPATACTVASSHGDQAGVASTGILAGVQGHGGVGVAHVDDDLGRQAGLRGTRVQYAASPPAGERPGLQGRGPSPGGGGSTPLSPGTRGPRARRSRDPTHAARGPEGGGDFAEVFVEDSARVGVLDDAKVEELSSGRDRGAGIRVVGGDTTGFAHTADLSDEACAAAAEAAAAAAARPAGACARWPSPPERDAPTRCGAARDGGEGAKVALLGGPTGRPGRGAPSAR